MKPTYANIDLYLTSGSSPPPLPPGIGLKPPSQPNPIVGWFVLLVLANLMRRAIRKRKAE